jgi:hypothetical protein
MGKKIIIVGSRLRDTEGDFKTVFEAFKRFYNEGDIIISGGCPKGGDRFAEIIAQRMGLTEKNGGLIIHRPERPPKGSPKWAYTQAFYKRNGLVANETEEDSIILACVAPNRTGGTEDTIKKVERRGKVDLNNIRIL